MRNDKNTFNENIAVIERAFTYDQALVVALHCGKDAKVFKRLNKDKFSKEGKVALIEMDNACSVLHDLYENDKGRFQEMLGERAAKNNGNGNHK